MQSTALILTTLDELPGLRASWGRVPADTVRECVAVDGGSTDGTQEFFRERGIRVIEQERPGWGEAVRVGVRATTARSIVFFAPDGNQDPEDIPLLVEKLHAGNDLVIASRFMPESVHAEDGQCLRPRARGCRAFTRAANRLFGGAYRIADATNGFRAFTREAFLKLGLDAPGFELAYQMTIRAMKHRLRVAEVPTFEGPRLVGPSKFRVLPAGWQHVKVLGREWIDSLP